MMRVDLLSPLQESVALRTGWLLRAAMLPSVAEMVPNVPSSLPWFRNISDFAAGGRTMAIVPVVAAPSADGSAAVGELSMIGNIVSNSGSATSEFRATAWLAEAAATITAAGGAGAVWTHGLATQNRTTLVYGDGSGYLGDCWVVRGSNADTIYNSGSYRGPLQLRTIKGINPKSVVQTSLTVGAGGQLITAAINTAPLVMAEADASGLLGELYAVREPTGWRIHRGGSANISCRIAIVNLV